MLGLLLFILTFLAGFMGAHYLLYATVIRFFAVTAFASKMLLYFVPFGLTMSFIVSALLLRAHRNVVTEGYGLIVVLWLGLFVNLLVVCTGIWLVYGAGALAGRVPNMRIVGWAALALAMLITAVGIWNARAPVITRIEVTLTHLPEHWKGKTVVQLSDVHLGIVRRTGYLEKIIKRVDSLSPELVLITGDLFDGMGGRFEKMVGPLNRLRARRGVFFVTGNHEGYLGLDGPLSILAKTHFRVLDNEVAEVDGLQIVGVSFPEHNRKKESKKALSLASAIDPAKPNILMFHTPTDVDLSPENRGVQQNRTYLAPNLDFTFARKHGIDLQLSGHTHQGQLFPFTFVSRWIFKGYDFGLHQLDGFSLYTTSGTGTWGPPLRTTSRSEIVAITLR